VQGRCGRDEAAGRRRPRGAVGGGDDRAGLPRDQGGAGQVGRVAAVLPEQVEPAGGDWTWGRPQGGRGCSAGRLLGLKPRLRPARRSAPARRGVRGLSSPKGLAKRADVLFVDILAGGEEVSAVALGGLDGRLVHDALPSTSAVTELRAHSILHVFSDATRWRTGLLAPEEVAALTPPPPGEDVPLDARAVKRARRPGSHNI
jgi:hypothetical protein